MCIFYFWCANCNSKWLLERDRDHVKKAERMENVSLPITRTTHFFGKVKKNSESLVKKQVPQFTSTRSCLINTNCFKLSSILRFCSLFRLLVILFLFSHLITNERTT